MAEVDKSSSLVGSATKAIADAWDFFIPIFGRIFFLWLTTVAIGAGVILRPTLVVVLDKALDTSPNNIFALFDQYKLTSLLPVLALIAVAAIASTFDRIVMILGGLVPLSVNYSNVDLLQQRVNPRELWYLVPDVKDLTQLQRIIDVQCSKARALAYVDLLQDDDFWRNRGSKHYVQFTFSKFLMLWVFAWTLILEEMHRGGNALGLRVLFLGLCIFLWAIYNLLQYAYALEQEMYSRVNVAMALLVVETNRLLPATDERKREIDEQLGDQDDGWWWFGLPSARWLYEAKSMKSPKTRLRRLYLRWFKSR